VIKPRAIRYPARPTVPPTLAPGGNRAPIGPDAVRAAYRAHTATNHQGRLGYECPTCGNYLRGISAAAARKDTP
jgi:hypothetical protein